MRGCRRPISLGARQSIKGRCRVTTIRSDTSAAVRTQLWGGKITVNHSETLAPASTAVRTQLWGGKITVNHSETLAA